MKLDFFVVWIWDELANLTIARDTAEQGNRFDLIVSRLARFKYPFLYVYFKVVRFIHVYKIVMMQELQIESYRQPRYIN